MTWRTIITSEVSRPVPFKKRSADRRVMFLAGRWRCRRALTLREREMINQIRSGSWSPGNCFPIVQGTCYFGKSSLSSLPANFAGPYAPKLLPTSWVPVGRGPEVAFGKREVDLGIWNAVYTPYRLPPMFRNSFRN